MIIKDYAGPQVIRKDYAGPQVIKKDYGVLSLLGRITRVRK